MQTVGRNQGWPYVGSSRAAHQSGHAKNTHASFVDVQRVLLCLAVDAVDVGRFSDHQTAVVDARLHRADIIAHDKGDIGLPLPDADIAPPVMRLATTVNPRKPTSIPPASRRNFI